MLLMSLKLWCLKEDAAHSDAASYAPSEDSTDDEETLEEQEKQENVNHSEELLDLQKEGKALRCFCML